MQISRHCSEKIVGASFLPALIAVVAAIATFQVYLFSFNYYMTTIRLVKEKPTAVLQHGDYWVLQNYIRNEPVPNLYFYNLSIGIAMQGTHEDIYKLQYLYTNPYFKTHTSYAVYIQDKHDLNRTLTAIAYVRNCGTSEGRNLILEFVSFHLYFHIQHFMHEHTPFEEVYKYFGPHIDCAKKISRVAAVKHEHDKLEELNTELAHEDSELERSVIAGKNIAQIASSTIFTISCNEHTYPVVNIELAFINSFVFSTIGFNRDTTDTVLLLPLLMVHNMNRQEHIARMGKKMLQEYVRDGKISYYAFSNEPYDTQQWLNSRVGVYEEKTFASYFKELLEYPTYFVGTTANFPLLTEHKNLTLLQSENLRIMRFKLQSFNFIVPSYIYLLQNYTKADAVSHNVLDTIDEHILNEYVRIFSAN